MVELKYVQVQYMRRDMFMGLLQILILDSRMGFPCLFPKERIIIIPLQKQHFKEIPFFLKAVLCCQQSITPLLDKFVNHPSVIKSIYPSLTLLLVSHTAFAT